MPKLDFPVIRLMTNLIVIRETSTVNSWKQIQKSTVEYWAEISETSPREGGVIILAKGSRP